MNERTLSLKRFMAVIFISWTVFLSFVEFVWIEDVFDARTAASWSTSDGTVLESKVAPACKHGYQPHVRYTYTVGDHQYEGHRIAFGPSGCLTQTAASDLSAQYPVGKLRVYFDPQHPKESALIVGTVMQAAWANICGVGTLCIVALCGAVALLYASRE